MSREPHEPIPGAGLHHAAAMAAAFLVAFAYPIAATAAGAIEGFPVLLSLAVTVGVGIAAAFISVAWPYPKAAGLATRAILLLALITAVRFTVPSPGTALAEVRAGDAPIISGAMLVLMLLVAVGYGIGHATATGTATIATPAPTTEVARTRDQRAMVAWWSAQVVLVAVLGAMSSRAGTTGSMLVAGSALTTLVLLADLRLRTAPPDGARPAIITASRRLRSTALVLALLVTVAGAAVLTPLFPVEELRRPPSMPNLERWLVESTDELQDALDDDLEGFNPVPEEIQEDATRGREWNLPTIPWQLPVAVAVLLVAIALRPHRWRLGWHQLLRLLRIGRTPDVTEPGELGVVDPGEVSEEDREPGGRLRRALRRLRPRTREPREEVLHHYFHVERLLERQEQGRQPYETPHEHAVRVHVSDAHAALADLAADARFARVAPHGDAVARARELRREIEAGLRAARR